MSLSSLIINTSVVDLKEWIQLAMYLFHFHQRVTCKRKDTTDVTAWGEKQQKHTFFCFCFLKYLHQWSHSQSNVIKKDFRINAEMHKGPDRNLFSSFVLNIAERYADPTDSVIWPWQQLQPSEQGETTRSSRHELWGRIAHKHGPDSVLRKTPT